jgi:hypothetical protein
LKFFLRFLGVFVPVPNTKKWYFSDLVPVLKGKLKFQITNQQITIQTNFSGLKIEDIPQQNMQQCAAKFAAPDFRI